MNNKLRTCDDCGGKVSKRAATCPHCGAPQDHRDEIVDEIEEKQDVVDQKRHDDWEHMLKEESYRSGKQEPLDWIDLIGRGFLVLVAVFVCLMIIIGITNKVLYWMDRSVLLSDNISSKFDESVIAEMIIYNEIIRNDFWSLSMIYGSLILTVGWVIDRKTNSRKNRKYRSKLFISMIYRYLFGYISYIIPQIVFIFAYYSMLDEHNYFRLTPSVLKKSLEEMNYPNYYLVIVPIIALAAAIVSSLLFDMEKKNKT